MLHLLRVAQDAQLVARAAEPEVSRRPVTRVAAHFIAEATQLVARKKRQANVDVRAELRAESTGRAPGAAFAQVGSALDDEDVADARSGEVPGDARAHDAAAHHDDVGHGGLPGGGGQGRRLRP